MFQTATPASVSQQSGSREKKLVDMKFCLGMKLANICHRRVLTLNHLDNRYHHLSRLLTVTCHVLMMMNLIFKGLTLSCVI